MRPDAVAMMVTTVPVLLPALAQAGVDLIYGTR